MQDKELIIYPALNTTSPKIPERSYLYSLKPIGIGSPYCESIKSYLGRLERVMNFALQAQQIVQA